MQRKMILIPTPGQTEQQYLADYFMQQGWGFASTQDSLDLSATLQAASEYHYRFPTLAYFNTDRLQELLSAIVWRRH